MSEIISSRTAFLRNLSPDDFLVVGMNQIAYIRPIMAKGQSAWALHAADGTLLTVQGKEAMAQVAARQNDLETVMLQ